MEIMEVINNKSADLAFYQASINRQRLLRIGINNTIVVRWVSYWLLVKMLNVLRTEEAIILDCDFVASKEISRLEYTVFNRGGEWI